MVNAGPFRLLFRAAAKYFSAVARTAHLWPKTARYRGFAAARLWLTTVPEWISADG
jgi:hypothetical protein